METAEESRLERPLRELDALYSVASICYYGSTSYLVMSGM